MHFESDSSNRISDFESFMKLSSSVLRAQTIRLKSKPTASLLDKTITVDLDESDGAIEKQPSKETKNSKDSAEEVSAKDDDNTEDEVEDSAEEVSANDEDNP